jgi:hypothetical protein
MANFQVTIRLLLPRQEQKYLPSERMFLAVIDTN